MDIPHTNLDVGGLYTGLINLGGWHHLPPAGSGSMLLWATALVQTWVHTVAAPDLPHWLAGWNPLDGQGWGALLAQAGQPQHFNQNILADLSRAWNNFIKTGQAAALGIGLFIGYMFRVFTSSG